MDDKTWLLFVVFGNLSTKGSTLCLNYDLTEVVKMFLKRSWGIFQLSFGFWFVFFCPVELDSLELTGAQAFFWFVCLFVFLALRSMFWCFLFLCFLKGML